MMINKIKEFFKKLDNKFNKVKEPAPEFKDYYIFCPRDGKGYEFTGKLIYKNGSDREHITIYKTNSGKIVSVVDGNGFSTGPYVRICKSTNEFSKNPTYIIFWLNDDNHKFILKDLYKKRIIEPLIEKID